MKCTVLFNHYKELMVFCSFVLVFVADIVFAETNESNVMVTAQQQTLGAYLTRAGNCMGCHTAKGGEPFAGGRQISTSFGVFVTPNITPDKETGIGDWSQEDFWQAIHQGKSRDGRLLYPAFPYTEYTKVTRHDANAIFDYLKSLPSVSQINPSSNIRFPYNFEPLLYLWRSFYFKQGTYQTDTSRSETWNRGAYLVQGLGHCNACHTTRNLVGASDNEILEGGQLMGVNWYAPSLNSHMEAGAGGSTEEIAELLATGISKNAVASGPMATIVRQSLQYLSSEDIYAMAVYLKSLTEHDSNVRPGVDFSVMLRSYRSQMEQGGQIYEQYCQDCHGVLGQGVPGVYPPLAGNRSVIMDSPLNTVRSVLNGGYPATTKGNPQPYGMPPFQQILRDQEVALVISYIRNAWGNSGGMVTAVDIDRIRSGK